MKPATAPTIFNYIYIFKSQLKLASELKLPLVLHGRGFTSFETIFHELKFHLNNDHNIHWHCINPRSNLNVMSNFLQHFNNSFIDLNGSMITSTDDDDQKKFNSWLVTQNNIIDRIIFETDYPFLKPSTLEPNQYNPISGITISAQHIVNILRIKNLNTTKIID
jgi:Tat protein secretion system quality control protein TatD with DNase activity